MKFLLLMLAFSAGMLAPLQAGMNTRMGRALGDPFYAEGAARAFPRLMLHSETLQFRHPDGGQGTRVTAKAPF